ncbi:hypothetical protein VNO80_14117 [Phaseolus coccineus]|uniref:Uncharacterized protein n=1 Tax=Phaseolus coccineus TaxID=3886 RepID=A0AAN9RAH3_PHACN
MKLKRDLVVFEERMIVGTQLEIDYIIVCLSSLAWSQVFYGVCLNTLKPSHKLWNGLRSSHEADDDWLESAVQPSAEGDMSQALASSICRRISSYLSASTNQFP